jgi:uncharacterized protein YdeI (YjbR/CyaY-like superfamily)
MGRRDPRVDAYIEKSADFAKPILTHLRAVVHAACPDVEETMKWSSPSFMYKGMLCGVNAFKAYCTFGFWKSGLVLGEKASRDPALQFGHIEAVKDLPSKKTLTALIHKAMALNDAGVKMPPRPRKPAKKLVAPPALKAALVKNKKAQAAFDAFSPSHKREYAQWIRGAKGEDTRERRVKTAIEWIAEGKSRNWKYQ